MLRIRYYWRLSQSNEVIGCLGRAVSFDSCLMSICLIRGGGLCQRNWKERLHSSRAAREALVQQSLSVWLWMERKLLLRTRKVLTRLWPSSKPLNAQGGRLSLFRRTPRMPTPAKPPSKKPLRHLEIGRAHVLTP